MAKIKKSAIRISYASAVHDEKEKERVIKVLDEHRTIIGSETREFEKRVAKYFGKKYGIMVNSGSSANILAFDILNLPPGTEVITPILTFSTTIAPIVQKGLIPVFVDVEEGKYTINVNQIESLITRKTRAIMVPLLMGNVPDMKRLQKLAKKYDLYLIEDSCDTLGAEYDNLPTGSFTDITTTSFYGSHIITAGGGGGMLLMNNSEWRDRAKVLRGWGRNSSLFSESESIIKRFQTKIGSIPYDAKFIFDEIGYNFLPSELGAAFGNAQIKKLPKFKQIRKNNFNSLLKLFSPFENFFTLPVQLPQVNTQWLAFPITIKKSAPFSRIELVKFLEKNNIQTRPIFTGNILYQPGFKNIKFKNTNLDYHVANEIMKYGFVIGCHHGLNYKHLKIIEETFKRFLKKY